jgi:hypothetical protein
MSKEVHLNFFKIRSFVSLFHQLCVEPSNLEEHNKQKYII